MIPVLEYGISCPPDWVRLSLDRSEDIRGWSKNTAEDLCERNMVAGYELDKRSMRKDLSARAIDSRSRDPFYAFALYPDGFSTALATLEVELIHPDATVPEITLDWLADTFSAHDFDFPKVTRSDLPIGPAVRIRQNFAADNPPPGEPGILLETITYGVLPTGTETALMLFMSWTVPGLEAEMEDAADSVAQMLTVDF